MRNISFSRRQFCQLGLSSLAGLAALDLSACGGSSSVSGNGPVDLNLWVYPAVPEVSAPPANNWFLAQAIKQKLNINLKVTLIPLGTDGDTKVSAAAAANALPDLFQITNSNLFLQWVQLGLVGPVDNLLPMMPQRTKARYSNSVLRKLGTFNDKLYALYEATPLNKRQGVYIRKDWLDKLGLAAPTTLDEFLNVARAFTAQDPDGDGKNDTYGFSATLDSTVLGLGSQFNFLYGAYGLPGTWDLRTPGKVSLNLHDPAYLQATEFVKQLVVNKVIDPDWTTLGTDDFRARWKQGKYGIFADDFSATFGQANYQAFDENNPNGVLVPLSPPKGSGGSAYLGVNSDIAIGVAASQQAISSGKGPAIARLLEWLNSGEGYYLSGFGKEGINYKLDAQKNIITTGVPQPWTTHAAQTGIQIRNLSLNGSPAELKARYPSYKSIKGRTIDPMKVYLTQAAMPWIDVTSTSAIPPAANQADINRFVSEGIVQFVTGQKPLTAATWSTFLKNLDSLNVSDWVSKANSTLKTKGLLPT